MKLFNILKGLPIRLWSMCATFQTDGWLRFLCHQVVRKMKHFLPFSAATFDCGILEKDWVLSL